MAEDTETTNNIIKLPPSLIVDEDSPDFGVYPLMGDETSVGRSPDSDIQLLHDRTISRIHLKIIKTRDTFRIKDLNRKVVSCRIFSCCSFKGDSYYPGLIITCIEIKHIIGN